MTIVINIFFALGLLVAAIIFRGAWKLSRAKLKAACRLSDALDISLVEALEIVEDFLENPVSTGDDFPVRNNEGKTLPHATLEIQHLGYKTTTIFAYELNKAGSIQLEKSESLVK